MTDRNQESPEETELLDEALNILISETEVSENFHSNLMKKVRQDDEFQQQLERDKNHNGNKFSDFFRGIFSYLDESFAFSKSFALISVTAVTTFLLVFFPMKYGFENTLISEKEKNKIETSRIIQEEGEKILLAARYFYENRIKTRNEYANLIKNVNEVSTTKYDVPDEFDVFIASDSNLKENESFICNKNVSDSESLWVSALKSGPSGEVDSILEQFFPATLDQDKCSMLEESLGIRPNMPILVISKFASIRLSGDLIKETIQGFAKIDKGSRADNKRI